MSATAANLIERVLPPSTPLRQWVLTFPFPWRPRLAQDGELLGRLTQIFVDSAKPPLWGGESLAIARYLAAAGELTDVPSRAPGRGPPYWKSRVLRLQALGDNIDSGAHGSKGDEAA